MSGWWANFMWLWSWQALVLIASAAIAATALRSGSAAHRHTYWLVVLLSTALLPLATRLVVLFPELPRPAVSVPLPESLQLQVHEKPPAAVMQEVLSPEQFSAPRRRWPSAAKAAFWLWLCGMLIFLSRSARSYLLYRRYRAAASYPRSLKGAGGKVAVAYSADVVVPVLVGFRRPVILLPAHMEQWTSSEEQQAVILHELAHYERRDHLVSLLQTLVGAALFFHPAVRYVARQLSVERELDCDERVLKAGIAPTAYAEAILKIAERQLAQQEIVSPAMNASGRLLERRLQMIRSYNRVVAKGSGSLSRVRLAMVVLFAVLVLPERVLISQTPAASPSTVAPVQVPGHTPRLGAAEAGGVAEMARPQRSLSALSSSKLMGTVRDPRGRIVSGLEVLLAPSDPPAGSPHSAVTNAAGIYEFSNVTPGRYILSAGTGFHDFAAPVTLTTARTHVLSFELVRVYEVGGGAPAPPPGAQAESGSLSGRIFDQTGAVVPGVFVELRNASGALVTQSLSNGAGAYMLVFREPGRYTVVARLPGFQTHTRTLDTTSGQNVTHNVLLRLAEVHTTVALSAQKPAASAEPEGPAAPVRVGGVISQTYLTYSPRPVYPPTAANSNVQGQVVLRAVIGVDGTIVSVQPHPSEGTDNLELIQAAMDSVKQWRYRPALLNGVPIEVSSTITVDFSLMD